MSYPAPLADDIHAPEKNVASGISKETWKMLEEKWGSRAVALHKLNIFLNFHGKYEHLDNVPNAIAWKMTGPFFNNRNIELAEIRYGKIPEIASSKNSLWFVLKHHKEAKDQISSYCIFLSMVYTFNKDETIKDTILPDVPMNFIEATEHESVTYVLLAMHAEPNEWNSVFNVCKGRLELQESIIVCINDSNSSGWHRSAIWQGIENDQV